MSLAGTHCTFLRLCNSKIIAMLRWSGCNRFWFVLLSPQLLLLTVFFVCGVYPLVILFPLEMTYEYCSSANTTIQWFSLKSGCLLRCLDWQRNATYNIFLFLSLFMFVRVFLHSLFCSKIIRFAENSFCFMFFRFVLCLFGLMTMTTTIFFLLLRYYFRKLWSSVIERAM